MTVSPQGRPSKAEPSPTGQTADPPSNPPTLLRLPNLDPARSNDPAHRSAEAGPRSVGPEALHETPATAAESISEWDRSEDVPFGPIENPESPSADPICGSQDNGIPSDDGHANLPEEKLTETFATDPAEAQPAIPEPTRTEDRWYPEPQAPPRDSGPDPHRLPPRQTPVRQDVVPEGRSWMERLGSQSIVLIVLVALAAAAIVAGHHRESGVESPSEVGAQGNARVADVDANANRRPKNFAAARSESPENSEDPETPEAFNAPQRSRGPRDVSSDRYEITRSPSDREQADVPHANRRPAATHQVDTNAHDDSLAHPASFAIAPPEDRLANDSSNTPRSSNASGGSPDPDQASSQPEHARSKVAARFAHERPLTQDGPLAQDGPAELNAPETSPNRPSDVVRSGNLRRETDSPAAADLTGSEESNAPQQPRYRRSPTPWPVRDWTEYLPDLQTDYVAEAPGDGRDDDSISTSPTGNDSSSQHDGADGSLTFPTDLSSQFQR